MARAVPVEVSYQRGSPARSRQSPIFSNSCVAHTPGACAPLSELSYVNTVAAAVAGELSEQYDGTARVFLDAAASQLLDPFTGSFEIYVACFCECGDLLSQWRGYAGSEGGYALGLEPEPMRTDTGLLLRKVVYDKVEQKGLVREILAFVARRLADVNAPQPVDVTLALIEAGNTLTEAAFCFKNPGFREEREWRLIHRVLPDQHLEHTQLKFRATATGMVPYVELRPNGQQPGVDVRLPVAKLVVGPNPHPEAAQLAAQRLLNSTGFGEAVCVCGSRIPLRV